VLLGATGKVRPLRHTIEEGSLAGCTQRDADLETVWLDLSGATALGDVGARVLVEPSEGSEAEIALLSRGIARKGEESLTYPG